MRLYVFYFALLYIIQLHAGDGALLDIFALKKIFIDDLGAKALQLGATAVGTLGKALQTVSEQDHSQNKMEMHQLLNVLMRLCDNEVDTTVPGVGGVPNGPGGTNVIVGSTGAITTNISNTVNINIPPPPPPIYILMNNSSNIRNLTKRKTPRTTNQKDKKQARNAPVSISIGSTGNINTNLHHPPDNGNVKKQADEPELLARSGDINFQISSEPRTTNQKDKKQARNAPLSISIGSTGNINTNLHHPPDNGNVKKQADEPELLARSGDINFQISSEPRTTNQKDKKQARNAPLSISIGSTGNINTNLHHPPDNGNVKKQADEPELLARFGDISSEPRSKGKKPKAAPAPAPAPSLNLQVGSTGPITTTIGNTVNRAAEPRSKGRKPKAAPEPAPAPSLNLQIGSTGPITTNIGNTVNPAAEVVINNGGQRRKIKQRTDFNIQVGSTGNITTNIGNTVNPAAEVVINNGGQRRKIKQRTGDIIQIGSTGPITTNIGNTVNPAAEVVVNNGGQRRKIKQRTDFNIQVGSTGNITTSIGNNVGGKPGGLPPITINNVINNLNNNTNQNNITNTKPRTKGRKKPPAPAPAPSIDIKVGSTGAINTTIGNIVGGKPGGPPPITINNVINNLNNNTNQNNITNTEPRTKGRKKPPAPAPAPSIDIQIGSTGAINTTIGNSARGKPGRPPPIIISNVINNLNSNTNQNNITNSEPRTRGRKKPAPASLNIQIGSTGAINTTIGNNVGSRPGGVPSITINNEINNNNTSTNENNLVNSKKAGTTIKTRSKAQHNIFIGYVSDDPELWVRSKKAKKGKKKDPKKPKNNEPEQEESGDPLKLNLQVGATGGITTVIGNTGAAGRTKSVDLVEKFADNLNEMDNGLMRSQMKTINANKECIVKKLLELH